MSILSTEEQAQDQLPSEWEIDRFYINGNNKLCATFTRGEVEVVVHPHRPDNYLPGLAPAHMVRKDNPPGIFEIIDKGLDTCKEPEDALRTAVQHIQSLQH